MRFVEKNHTAICKIRQTSKLLRRLVRGKRHGDRTGADRTEIRRHPFIGVCGNDRGLRTAQPFCGEKPAERVHVRLKIRIGTALHPVGRFKSDKRIRAEVFGGVIRHMLQIAKRSQILKEHRSTFFHRFINA